MGAEYQILTYDTAGNRTNVITDYLWLQYKKAVNEPGLLQFRLTGTHGAISTMVDKGVVEVLRRNPDVGLGWYTDFTAIYRGQSDNQNELRVWEAAVPGITHMLSWNLIAWYANTVNRSVFASVAAETIMKTLVNYNVGANATAANGRYVDGVDGSSRLCGMYTITVQADGGTGATMTIGCAWDKLLDTLQSLYARGSGGDFDLIKTGPTTFDFRWYAGQRGTDKSATVLLSLTRGNMADIKYDYNRIDEATVAIVGGQGQDTSRIIAVRNGADYSATNRIETFVNGSSYASAGALNAIGDGALYTKRARQKFTFGVMQSYNAYYGLHYNVGDLVSASTRGTTVTQKVVAATVLFDSNGDEKIAIDLATNG
jgi:hypothetical protein